MSMQWKFQRRMWNRQNHLTTALATIWTLSNKKPLVDQWANSRRLLFLLNFNFLCFNLFQTALTFVNEATIKTMRKTSDYNCPRVISTEARDACDCFLCHKKLSLTKKAEKRKKKPILLSDFLCWLKNQIAAFRCLWSLLKKRSWATDK